MSGDPVSVSGDDRDAGPIDPPPHHRRDSPRAPRRSGPPAERRQRRRQALLDAALARIGTQGYATATVERICRDAGVSTRDFYQEFANREDLLGTLFEVLVNGLAQRVAETTATPEAGAAADTVAKVSAFVHGMVDDPRVARLVIIESVGISEATERRRRQAYRAFSVLVEQLAKGYASQGVIPARDFRILATGMVGGVYEIIADWLHCEQPCPVDELADGAATFVRLVFAGTLPEEATLPPTTEVG